MPGHPYRISVTGGSGSGKTNSLFNVVGQQIYIVEIYLYANDLLRAKYQLLNNKSKSTSLKHKIQVRKVKYWSYLMIRLLVCLVTKKLNQVELNYLLDVEN